MRHIDSWVLNRYEAVAHSIELRTSINCFQLAIWSLHAYVILTIIDLALDYTRFGNLHSLLFRLLLICIVAIFIHGWIRSLDDSRSSAQTRKFINPIREHSQAAAVRTFVLFIYGGTTISLVSLAIFISLDTFDALVSLITYLTFLSAFYWASCNPLPPGTRHARTEPALARS